MVDKSLAEINVTIWGSAAESFDPTGNPVVAIKGAKVSDYNNVSLSTLGSSVIQVLDNFTLVSTLCNNL